MSLYKVMLIGVAVSTALSSGVFAQHTHDASLEFSIRSVRNGHWSDAETWTPRRVPKEGDRILITRGTEVVFDVCQPQVIRLLQVVGTLRFADDRDTELNVGILAVAHQEECSEHGFACEFEGAGAGPGTSLDQWPSLIVGTRERPIPRDHTARIRLHYLEGMDPQSAPALACCSGRMEIHGSPLSQSWFKLAQDSHAGGLTATISAHPAGWRVGDQVLITATTRVGSSGSFRQGTGRAKQPQTEQRTLVAIEGDTLTFDKPLEFDHLGRGEFRGEVANLSRNVIVESADPDGVRGHTVYHRFSKGGISYARFAHLGKEDVLGRYPIHFHLVGDSMRGSSVEGVAIVDSQNRWITIHGTHYLVVRDCVGYRSVGHGFFMEDGTEVYNLLDRNLAIQACRGKPLPKQALPFDPNEGAGFWWANGLNTLVHNVATENDEYGYRYDIQRRSNFDCTLPIRQPDGTEKLTDVRTLPIWRFEDNEAHAEGFYGMVVAANGNDQPDTPIDGPRMLERIQQVDWSGPDPQHPHVIRGLSIWGSHYAFRPHSPSMLIENVRIHDAAYGIYRPAFDHHEYRNLDISDVQAEPFNRGMDDASAQAGPVTVDGLKFTSGYGNQTTPLIQISDVNLTGRAVTHMRNVTVERPAEFSDRWPLFNRGVGTRVPPIKEGVPIFVHDLFGPGRHAKVISAAAKDLLSDGKDYRAAPPLTGDEALVAEVTDLAWPEVLQPVDDLPPATIITSLVRSDQGLVVRGISHDNGRVVAVTVNGKTADVVQHSAGVTHWRIELELPPDGQVSAKAQDDSGNEELTSHQVDVRID